MAGTALVNDLRAQRWWIRSLMVVAFAATELSFLILGAVLVPHAAQIGVFSGGGPVAAADRSRSTLDSPRSAPIGRSSSVTLASEPAGQLPSLATADRAAVRRPSLVDPYVSRLHPVALTPRVNETASVPQRAALPSEPASVDSPVNPPLIAPQPRKVALVSGATGVQPTTERRRFGQPAGQSDTGSSDQGASPRPAAAPFRTRLNDWTTIESQGFESNFPPSGGKWSAFDNDGATNGELYWDDTSAKADVGSRSAWAADGGTNRRDPVAGQSYTDRMQSWMVYGPFSLAGANEAELAFRYWNRSESGYDYFKWLASGDGTNFSGYQISGDQSSWRSETLKLATYLGDSSVWIAFVFTSDGSTTNTGPFVDQIELRKRTAPTTGNLTVTVSNVTGGSPDVPGDTGSVELFQSSGTPVATSSTTRKGPGQGQASFSALTPGQYVFNVYQNGPQGREDWGVSHHFAIVAGSNSQSFTRHNPYVTDVRLKRDATGTPIASGDRLDPGTWVRAELSIKNPATYTISNVSGQFRLDRTGDGTTDQSATTESRSLAAGDEQTFTARIKVDDLGDYRRAVTARYSNLTVLSDGWAWANAFTVAWPPNNPPTLSNLGVSPSTGNRSTTFRYTAVYTDPDGDAPGAVELSIDDGTWQPMNRDWAYFWEYRYYLDTTLSVGSHTFKVRATDSRGSTTTSGYQSGPTVENRTPSIPTSPSPADGATGVSPESPTVSWSAATDPDGDSITYQVHYRSSGGSFGQWSSPSSSLSYQIPASLLSGTTYQWQVRAVDSLGASQDGPTWSFTTTPPNSPPTLSSGSVTPATGNRSTSFHYEVTYTDAENDPPTMFAVDLDNSTRYPMTQKYQWDQTYTDGKDYILDVTLALGSHTGLFRFNDGQQRHADVTLDVTGPTVSNRAPTAATSPSPSHGATGVDPRGPTLGWSAATDPDGDSLSYQVRYWVVGDSPPAWISVSERSYSIPQTLRDSTVYDWQVRVTDSVGASTDGPEWRFTTKKILGSITLDVRNVDWSMAADVPGANGIVRLYQGSTLVATQPTLKTGDRRGSAAFSSLMPGSYLAKVFHTGPFGEESWGETGTLSVGEAQDLAPTFTRRRPVAKELAFYRDAAHTQRLTSSDTVEVGATVYASVLVENLMSVTASPTVSLRIDRNKDNSFDVNLTTTILAIPAGQTSLASFSFSLTNAGSYSSSILVNTNGDLTDSWAWGDALTSGSRPVITGSSPADLSVTVQKTALQPFSISYTDSDNDVDHVGWILDTVEQSSRGASYTYTAPNEGGTHILIARVVDRMGLTAERTWTITVPANAPPTLSFSITDIDNLTKRVEFTTSDHENQSTTVSIYVDGTWKTGIPNVPPQSPFSSHWGWVATSGEVLGGEHTVRVEVTDGTNTKTESQTTRFTPAYSVSLVDIRQQWDGLRHDSVYQGAYGQVQVVPGGIPGDGAHDFHGATTVVVRNDGNTEVTYELVPGSATLFARDGAYQGEIPLDTPWTVGVAPYALFPTYTDRARLTIGPHAEGAFLVRAQAPSTPPIDDTVIVRFSLKTIDAQHPEDQLATGQSDVVFHTVTAASYQSADLTNFFNSLGGIATGAWQFFVGDDWDKLNDGDANVLERAFAGGMLVSNVLIVGEAKVAVKGAFAGGRKLTGELTASKLLPFLDDAAKGTAKGALARTKLQQAIRADTKAILGVPAGKAWLGKLTKEELELIGTRLADGSFGLDTVRFERFVKATNTFKDAKNFQATSDVQGYIQLALQAATRPSLVDDAVFAAERMSVVTDDLVRDGYSVAERLTVEKWIQVGTKRRPVDALVELGDASHRRYVLHEFKNIPVTDVQRSLVEPGYLEQFRHFHRAVTKGSPDIPWSAKNRLEITVSEFSPTNPKLFNKELSVALDGAKTSISRESGGLATIGLSAFIAPIITTNAGELLKTDSQLVRLDGVCQDQSVGAEVNSSTANVSFSESSQTWSYEKFETKDTHVYEVRCVDVGGSLSEADTITVLVDPPPVITTNDGQDFATNRRSIGLDGRAETFFSQVLVNGSSQFVTYDQARGVWRYANEFGYEGTHTFNVTAKTASGVESDPATIRVTYDATVPTVRAAPGGGEFSAPVTVTLTASEPGTIHYTTDGSVPTSASTRYTDPIAIGQTTTLSFIAVDAAGNTSAVGREVYTILIPQAPRVTQIEYPAELTGTTGLVPVKISGTKQAFERIVRRELETGDRVVGEPGVTTWSYTATVNVGDRVSIIGSPNVERLIAQAGGSDSSETVVRFSPTSTFALAATPPGGRFTGSVSVTLTAAQTIVVRGTVNDQFNSQISYTPPIEAIYFTTDGSAPTASSPRYAQSITLDRTTPVKFLAVGMVGHISPVAAETFTIDQETSTGFSWTTTPGDIGIGQPITLTLTNTGTMPLEYVNDPPYVITRDGVLIYPRAVSRAIGQLAVGQTRSWTWDQRDANQQQVPAGSYQIRISVVSGDVPVSATTSVLIGSPSP